MTSIIPDPSVYQGETAAALRAYQQALAAIGARRANTLQSYGFTAKVDPTTGQLSNYSIDPYNQYGQIQQLFGTQELGDHALEENNVGRGLGSSGLAQQLANRLRTAHGGQTLALGQQFLGDIGQEALDQVGARNTYSDATLQAQRDAIAQAIQNQQFSPAPVSRVRPTATAPGVRQSQTGQSSNPTPGRTRTTQPNRQAVRRNRIAPSARGVLPGMIRGGGF